MVEPRRPSLAERWEGLPGPVQLGASAAVAIPVLTVGHVALLNQPLLWRGIVYGVFWGLLLALLVVFATRNEAQKRREARERRDDPAP